MKLKNILFLTALVLTQICVIKAEDKKPPFYIKNNTCHSIALKISSNDRLRTLRFVEIKPQEIIKIPSWPKKYYGDGKQQKENGLRVRFYFWPQIEPIGGQKISFNIKKRDSESIDLTFYPYEPTLIGRYLLDSDENIALEYTAGGILMKKPIKTEELSVYPELPSF